MKHRLEKNRLGEDTSQVELAFKLLTTLNMNLFLDLNLIFYHKSLYHSVLLIHLQSEKYFHICNFHSHMFKQNF